MTFFILLRKSSWQLQDDYKRFRLKTLSFTIKLFLCTETKQNGCQTLKTEIKYLQISTIFCLFAVKKSDKKRGRFKTKQHSETRYHIAQEIFILLPLICK